MTCAERENTAVGARGRTTVVRGCVEEAANGSIARQVTTKSFAWLSLRRPTVRHELAFSRHLGATSRSGVCAGGRCVGRRAASRCCLGFVESQCSPTSCRTPQWSHSPERPLRAPARTRRTTPHNHPAVVRPRRSRRCSGAKSGACLGVEHHDGTRSALLRRAPQAPRRGAWHTQPLRARTRRHAVKQLSCSHACTRPHPTGIRACLPPLTAP